MALFDVYVEGATDPSPQAIQRLAEVMSQRYGLPAAELVNRLSKGRFRVKANLDDATAQTYVRDLEAIGARVTLSEARGGNTLPPPRPIAPPRSQTPSQPPPHPVTLPPRQRNESLDGGYSINRTSSPSIPPATEPARPASSSLPPANAPLLPPAEPRLPASSSLPPANAPRLPPSSSLPPATVSRPQPGVSLPPRNVGQSVPPGNQPYASGLSAAFAENTPVPELSAFDKQLSVGALDDGGAVEIDTSPVLPASIGPAAKPAAPKVDKPKDVPVDLFAPPEEQAAELKVELAAEEVAHRDARKRTATPALGVNPGSGVPVAVGPSSSSPVLRPKGTSIQPKNEPTPGVRLPSIDDDAPRWRFAAGVLASVVLGFIPANCVQSCRESSAFDSIDQHVVSVQNQAATSTSASIPYAQLDVFREEQIAKKKSSRRNIALVSMLIWALGGAGIGYVWFRRVPWDKIKFGQ